jgi:hypothetical protein
MMIGTSIRPVLALPVLVVALASRGHGQATGIPVRNAGVRPGVAVAVDLGLGRISRTGGDDQSRAIAATGSLGFGPFGVVLGLGRGTIDPAVGPDRSETTVTGAAQLTMFALPVFPLKLTWQADLARVLDGGSGSPWRGSLGLGAVVVIPAVVVSIRPWIAPRLEYLDGQPVRGGRLKSALSAGIDIELMSGLGFRLGYDSRVGWDNGNERATGISLGASYHFR